MIKTCRIKLGAGDISEAKLSGLSQLDGVHKCTHKAGKVLLEYDLSQCDYRTIHHYLAENGMIDAPSAFLKIKHALIIACEENERDYNENFCGWDYYVQSLYISNAPRDEK